MQETQETQGFFFNPWVRKIPWRRKQQPTPVFLPRKFHGQRSLAGNSSWSCKESDTSQHACMHLFPPLPPFSIDYTYIYVCVCVYIYIFKFFLNALQGTWDPTDAPCMGTWGLNHWTTREVLNRLYFLEQFQSKIE